MRLFLVSVFLLSALGSVAAEKTPDDCVGPWCVWKIDPAEGCTAPGECDWGYTNTSLHTLVLQTGIYTVRAFCAGNVVRLFNVDTQQVVARSDSSSRDTHYYDMGVTAALGVAKETHFQLQFFKYPPTSMITWDCYQSKLAYRSITRILQQETSQQCNQDRFLACVACAKRKPWEEPSLACIECMR